MLEKPRNHPLILAAILLTAFSLQALTWSNGHNWGSDFAGYIMQAISLADRTVDRYYEINTFMMSESSRPEGPIAYPWGFPLLLAPVYAFFGLDIMMFKLVGLVFFLAYLALLWFGFGDMIDLPGRIIITLIFACNPRFLQFGDQVLSDIPFLFFSTATVFWMCSIDKPQVSRNSVRQLSALFLIIAGATAMRPNGILLLCTFVIVEGLKAARIEGFSRDSVDRYLPGLFRNLCTWRWIVPIILLLVSLFVFKELFAQTMNDYQRQLLFWKNLSLAKLIDRMMYHAKLFSHFFGPSYLGAIVFLLSLWPFMAGLREKWRDAMPMIIYSGLTLALFIVLSFRGGLRYIFPVLPFYIFFFISGLNVLYKKNRATGVRAYGFGRAVLLLFACMSVWQIRDNLKRGRELADGPYTPNSREMFAFVIDNIPPEGIVQFRKPRVLYLFTGRKSYLVQNLRDFKFRDWYVVDKKNPAKIDAQREELFSQYPARIAFENDQFVVYQFL